MTQRRIPELDGVRGIAILLVLVWHYVACTLPPHADPMWSRLLGITWSGVDLFFVLSGFLLGGILLENRDAPNYYRAFYWRRVWRVLPLYCVVLAVCWRESALPLWTYLTFTQNIAMAQSGTMGLAQLAPTWSLAIEEQFYLLLPLLIRIVPLRAFPVIVVGAVAFRVWMYFGHANSGFAAHMLTPGRLDSLCLGVVGAALVGRFGARLLRLVFVLCLLCAGGLAWTSPAMGSAGMTLGGYTVLALLYLCLILLAPGTGVIAWTCRLWPLRQLGVISYGVYLLHLPVLLAMQQPFAAFVVTVALAALSWRFFERPLIGLGHRISYR